MNNKVIVFIVGLLFVIGCTRQNQESTLKELGSFKTQITLEGVPKLNNEIELLLKVDSIESNLVSYDYKLQVFLPEEIQLIQGDVEWTGDIRNYNTNPIILTVVPRKTGEYKINCTVRGYINSTRQGNVEITNWIYIDVGNDSGKSGHESFYKTIQDRGENILNPVR